MTERLRVKVPWLRRGIPLIPIAAILALLGAFGLMGSEKGVANHPEPPLPLTAPSVEALSACNQPPPAVQGVAIPTGQIGSLNVPPDRNNTSSSNEQLAGTVEALVIHANAEQDQKELTLDISGSHNVFDGELDSRSHAKVGGSWNQFRHGFEYGQRSEPGKTAFDLTGSNNCFSPPPVQEYENTPPVPAGFPLNPAFDPDGPANQGDGNILEHFAPGSAAATAAMNHKTAIAIDLSVPPDGVPDITEAAQPLGRYYVCGLSPLPAGARLAPGCSGTGASAIMDRNVQGQVLGIGLYFVTGRVKLSASNLNAVITIVSGQQLNVNGSFQGQGFSVFRPYTDASGAVSSSAVVGTLLFASQWDEAASLAGPTFPDGDPNSDTPNTDKAEDALKIEGSLSRFEGIIVATNGRTEIAGEQLDFRCPVMGDRVRVNGSKNYFNAAGCVSNPAPTITKTPDIATDGGGTIKAGEKAKFTITISNNGDTLENAKLDDVLPNDGGLTWTLLSATKNPGATDVAAACLANNGPPDPSFTDGVTLHCEFGDLLTGQSIIVVVESSATSSGAICPPTGDATLQNGTETAGPAGDAQLSSSNHATITDPGQIVVQCPDPNVVKGPDESSPPGPGNDVNAGSDAVFTITVTNPGPGTASSVTLDDNLPPGFTWSEVAGSDPGNFCSVGNLDVDAPPTEFQDLKCNFGAMAEGASASVQVSAPTTAANCGTIVNTVTITAAGDVNLLNNTNSAEIDIICFAIGILKQSTKKDAGGANVLVSNPGALFTVTGPEGFTVRDNNNPGGAGTKNDDDATTGEVCVDGLKAGTYTVNETAPPLGYAAASQSNVTVVAVAGECGAVTVNNAVFINPPLFDIQVQFRDAGSGETALLPAGIVCNTTTGTTTNPTVAGWDNSELVEDVQVPAAGQITITCTIAVDP